MILITTSRKPGRRTRSFAKDLQKALPQSKYVNRGKGNIYSIAERAEREGYTRILIVGETKGNPSIIRVVQLYPPRWDIQIYISLIKLCREVGCKKNYGDYVEVKGDLYNSVLKKTFGYTIEEGHPVILKEEKGLVTFTYDSHNVGPVFRVKGWDPIPSRLRQQSTLKT